MTHKISIDDLVQKKQSFILASSISGGKEKRLEAIVTFSDLLRSASVKYCVTVGDTRKLLLSLDLAIRFYNDECISENEKEHQAAMKAYDAGLGASEWEAFMSDE